MNVAGDVLFNLLFNTLAAFWLALALAMLVFRVFRLERSALGLGVLALPFVKVAWELLRGVPRSSFLWLSERGVRQTLGEFRVGFGATRSGPSVVAELWAEHAAGRAPQSAGDLATRFLRLKLGAHAAPALAFSVLAVSLGAFARWTLRRVRASARARRLAERAVLLERLALGGRVVSVFESSEHRGAPFAAGVLAPFVILPHGLRARLTQEELAGVLLHELAHVTRFDLVVLVVLAAFEQLFWYVPGIAFARRSVAALLERRADDAAVAAGVSRLALARALVITAELTHDAGPAPHPCVTGARSELALRVRRLLAVEHAMPASTGGVSSHVRVALSVLKVAAIAWCALGILAAVAFGNHGG